MLITHKTTKYSKSLPRLKLPQFCKLAGITFLTNSDAIWHFPFRGPHYVMSIVIISCNEEVSTLRGITNPLLLSHHLPAPCLSSPHRAIGTYDHGANTWKSLHDMTVINVSSLFSCRFGFRIGVQKRSDLRKTPAGKGGGSISEILNELTTTKVLVGKTL